MCHSAVSLILEESTVDGKIGKYEYALVLETASGDDVLFKACKARQRANHGGGWQPRRLV